MKYFGSLIAILFMGMPQLFSQFSLQGEFRPRFEYRGGYGRILSNDETPVFTVSQRSRLSAYYQTGILSFGFGIQDVRVWGDDNIYAYSGVAGSTASIDLNEAWIGIRPYKKGMIKIGRQYLAYEDQRILAKRGWNQSEFKYDAFLFQHIGDKFKADVGISWNNNKEILFLEQDPYTTGKMKSLEFIYLKYDVSEWLYISTLGIASGFKASDTTNDINMQGTYGLYLGAKKGALNALASAYYQNGKSRKGQRASAYMFSFNADYTIAKKYLLGAGMDYLSGSDHLNTDADYQSRTHTFDVLYGGRHKFYGHLDYFNNLPNSTDNGGLADICLKFKWTFLTSANAGFDFHCFMLQNNVADPSSETGDPLSKRLGREVDLYFSWDIVKFVNLTGGYSIFVATDSMEKLQGVYGNSRFPSWAWVMITAKPVFFEKAGN